MFDPIFLERKFYSKRIYICLFIDEYQSLSLSLPLSMSVLLYHRESWRLKWIAGGSRGHGKRPVLEHLVRFRPLLPGVKRGPMGGETRWDAKREQCNEHGSCCFEAILETMFGPRPLGSWFQKRCAKISLARSHPRANFSFEREK